MGHRECSKKHKLFYVSGVLDIVFRITVYSLIFLIVPLSMNYLQTRTI
jgi:hypothetical protein